MLQPFENKSYTTNRTIDGALLQPETRVQAALESARNQAGDRLEVANSALFDQALELAFEEGMRFQSLKQEQITLFAENTLLKNQIEELKIAQQREWAAILESTESKIHAIAFKIKTLIGELNFFQEQNKDKVGWLHKISYQYNGRERNDVIAFLDFKAAHPAIGYNDLWKIAEECSVVKYYSSLLQNYVLPHVDNFSLALVANLQDVYTTLAQAIGECHLQTVVSPIVNSQRAMPMHNFSKKGDALTLKLAQLKAENASLQQQKEKVQRYCLTCSRAVRFVIYQDYLEPCIKAINIGRMIPLKFTYENQLITGALPERASVFDKMSWKGAVEKAESIRNQHDLLLSQVKEMAQEFKIV